jgi:hypothetical protein
MTVFFMIPSLLELPKRYHFEKENVNLQFKGFNHGVLLTAQELLTAYLTSRS